ncbi:hypothetical protein WAE61_09030 [Comamonadaceae bacterium PP-2]
MTTKTKAASSGLGGALPAYRWIGDSIGLDDDPIIRLRTEAGRQIIVPLCDLDAVFVLIDDRGRARIAAAMEFVARINPNGQEAQHLRSVQATQGDASC